MQSKYHFSCRKRSSQADICSERKGNMEKWRQEHYSSYNCFLSFTYGSSLEANTQACVWMCALNRWLVLITFLWGEEIGDFDWQGLGDLCFFNVWSLSGTSWLGFVGDGCIWDCSREINESILANPDTDTPLVRGTCIKICFHHWTRDPSQITSVSVGAFPVFPLSWFIWLLLWYLSCSHWSQ